MASLTMILLAALLCNYGRGFCLIDVGTEGEVKISNKENGLVRTTTSTNEGTYRFDLLPSGVYEVRISNKGFATQATGNNGTKTSNPITQLPALTAEHGTC